MSGLFVFSLRRAAVAAVSVLLTFAALVLRPLPASADPIHDAVAQQNLSLVESLLAGDPSLANARDKDSNAPIHWAAWSGNVEVTALLLKRGADPKARKKDGWTPLHDAAWNGRPEVAKMLLAAGVPIDSPDAEDARPLHFAAWTNQVATARLLLDAGAAVDARKKNRVTPLETAAFFGHLDMARLLISRGAQVNARIYEGMTPLHQAARNGQLGMVALLLENGADRDAVRDDGMTPLHLAAASGQTATTAALLMFGADPNARMKDDRTPLAVAHPACADLLRGYLKAASDTRSLIAAREAANKALAGERGKPLVASVAYRSRFVGEEAGPEWTTSPLGADFSENLRLLPLPGDPEGRRYLGPLGSQNARLTLARLPPHTRVSVTVDLYILDSWDGDGMPGSGPDLWEMSVTGGPVLLRTTFSNIRSFATPGEEKLARPTAMQAFPGDYPLDHNPAFTGAAERKALGGRAARYRITRTFTHDAPYLVLNFAGMNLQTLADESWGIGSVEVRVARPAASGKRNRPKR